MRNTPLNVEDVEAVDALRETLAEANYTAQGISELFGGDFERDASELPVYRRRVPEGGPLETLVRLFTIDTPVQRKHLAEAIAPLGVERLERMGLVEANGKLVEPRIMLMPYRDLLIASDVRGEIHVPEDEGYVLGITPPSLVLMALTPRRTISRALDVGAGSGLQSLVAAEHADRVEAVDLNPRALAYAGLNARLNGLDNIELREGSAFDPVEGSTFGLIVSNPPYVISPDFEYAFRDSGLPGDSFCEGLVRTAPSFLEPGGFAVILAAWILRAGEGWAEPIARWVEGLGCDALFLHYRTEDPLTYASTWNATLRGDPAAYDAAVARWAEHHRKLGAESVGWGGIVLRRRDGDNWTRAIELDQSERLGDAGDHILRLFEAQDFLATVPDAQSLLEQRLELAPDHRLEQSLVLAGLEGHAQSATLRLAGGLHIQVALHTPLVETLWRIDRSRPLGHALEEAAQIVPDDVDPEAFVGALLPDIQRLVELGLLIPAYDV